MGVKIKKPKAGTTKKEASLEGGKPKLSTDLFPIVGIGASAGGLEPLEQFLSSVPENSGLGYVVIQHLDPTQKGMLPELLQRRSKMKVVQVTEGITVVPNHVYVIPPNKSMSILNGKLHLFESQETRGMHLPIDYFLHSLADDRNEKAVGIILSGMGSDGTSGLKKIKEMNGIVLVQSLETAKFDSMPRNAIDSVNADIVAPPSEMPEKLLAFLKRVPLNKSTHGAIVKDKSSLDKIIVLLHTYTGNDFSQYKNNTTYRRIERRMAVHKINEITNYVQYLRQNPIEGEILFKELMIGVTNFFRNPLVWENLKKTIFPSLISNVKSDALLRAWVPGCSTGEEAYSLAIVFKEAQLKSHKTGVSMQIFATDLDDDAIEKARKGIYSEKIAADVSPERLKRYFVKTENGYRVSTEIREMVVFAQHNITMHPPFTKIDFLSCRNLLIYMDSEMQKKLIGLFYYSIKPNGILLLGSSESMGTQGHLFTTIDNKQKIYKKSNIDIAQDAFDFPNTFSRTIPLANGEKSTGELIPNIQTLADQLLLKYFSPVGVLVNEDGDIIYTSGRTGKYLEPSVGKANMNIFAMLRDGLRQEFPIAFRKVLSMKETVNLRNIKISANGDTQTLDISLQAIEQTNLLKGSVMIIFTEVDDVKVKPTTNADTRNERQAQQDQELRHLRAEMQNTVEQLQLTNEELTSAKEKIQNLNAELQTVNAELLAKVDDYSRVDNDMKKLEMELEENILMHRMHLDSSSEISISLSASGEIKEFNPKAALFFGKDRKEVIGKNYLKTFVPESEWKKTEKEINKLAKKGKPGKFKMHVHIAGNTTVSVTCAFQILTSNLMAPKRIMMILTKDEL